jgi:hypothetical protein
VPIDLTKIRNKLNPPPDGQDVLRLKTGVVTALASDGTITVTLNGASISDVPVLSGSLLLSGAVVQVLSYRGSLLVIGTTASSKQVIIKSGDQNSNTNSTALVNDSELFFTTAPNATYIVDAYLSYGGAQAGDIRVAWSVPSGASAARYVLAPAVGLTSNESTSMVAIRRGATTEQIAGASGGTANDFTDWQEKSIIRTASTGGTAQLRFGQGTSSATVTVMRQDSFMIIERIA